MFSLSENALFAISHLNALGYEAYIVGGCVRDLILGSVPKDIDITTNALPEQIIRAFAEFRVIPTGISHGTVTVLIDHQPIEITTYRTDGVYTDHRRPENVRFVSSLKEDLSRRDFTMNAMAYHPQEGLIDLFSGREDIKNRRIQAVGNADSRFEEDALRILRAYRFMARLEFLLADECNRAVREKKELLRLISAERIFSELKGILTAPHPAGALAAMQKNAVLDWILPADINFAAIDRSVQNSSVRMALLFSEYSSEQAEAALKALKSDRQTMKSVLMLLSVKNKEHLITLFPVKNSLNLFGQEYFFQICEFHRALYPEEAAEIQSVRQSAENLIDKGECYSLAQLAVNGNDLKGLGVVGKECGRILNELLAEVMEGKLQNEKIALITRAGVLSNPKL